MHACNPQMEGLCDVLIADPLRRPQQDVGTPHPARRRFPFVDHVEQGCSLLFGKVNQVLVGHGDSSC